MEAMTVSKMMTRDDVAEVVGCGGRHIDNLIRDCGFPPGCKFGQLRRWTAESVHNWIQQQEQAAVPA